MAAFSGRSGRHTAGDAGGKSGRSGGVLPAPGPATGHGSLSNQKAAQQPRQSRGAVRNQHRHAARKKEVEEGMMEIKKEVQQEFAWISETNTASLAALCQDSVVTKASLLELKGEIGDLKHLILQLAAVQPAAPEEPKVHHENGQPPEGGDEEAEEGPNPPYQCTWSTLHNQRRT